MVIILLLLTFLAVLFVADQVRKMRIELAAELRRLHDVSSDRSRGASREG